MRGEGMKTALVYLYQIWTKQPFQSNACLLVSYKGKTNRKTFGQKPLQTYLCRPLKSLLWL